MRRTRLLWLGSADFIPRAMVLPGLQTQGLLYEEMMTKAKETQVEKRMRETGCRLMKTMTGDLAQPVTWAYSDSGKSARSDSVRKLLEAGKLVSTGDGLFDDAQTYRLAL